MDSYLIAGPLGSTDRRCPISEETLYGELRAKDSARRVSRREGNIKDWAQTLGLPCEDEKLTRYGRTRQFFGFNGIGGL